MSKRVKWGWEKERGRKKKEKGRREKRGWER